MAEKYRVGLLSFLNALPLVYKLQGHKAISPAWGLPAELFRMLQAGKLDAALTSSFAYAAKLRSRITDLGVAAEGQVLTVMLYAQDPLDEVTAIEEDPASLTSNALTRIIFHERRQRVKYSPCPNVRERLAPHTGRVIIGDNNFNPPFTYHYAYDIAALFHQHFKLPVVFAMWQGAENTPQPLVDILERAYAEVEDDWEGVCKYAEREWKLDHKAVVDYFGRILHFRLSPRDQDFLELFARKVRELKLTKLGQ
jgi:predicted solute-binding protein